jgi:hypothetical protein
MLMLGMDNQILKYQVDVIHIEHFWKQVCHYSGLDLAGGQYK